MNASYKFALLGAVGLMVIVIGVVAIQGSGKKTDETAENLPDPTPAEELAGNTPPANPAGSDRSPGRQTPPNGLGNANNNRPGLDRGTPPAEPVDPPEETDTSVDVALGPERPAEGGNPLGVNNLRGPTGIIVPEGSPVRPTPTPWPEDPATDPVTETPDPVEPDEPVVRPEPPTPTPRPTPEADRGGVPRTHTVEPGDVLWDIAERYYGDGNKWFEIAQANPTVDPTRLALGEVLRLPALEATEQPREEPLPPRPGEHQTYTVKPGQTLSHVAQEVYGNANAWRVIYHRNRDLIGASPDKVQAGMELIIPPRVAD